MRRTGFNAALIYTVLAAAAAGAQTNYVAVRGVVMDPQSLGIPLASVKLTDERTNRERETTADAHGAYEVGGLLPGTYLLEAGSTGFSVTKREVLLEVGQDATVDVMLQVGPAKESVTAEAAAELLKTTDATVGEVVDQRAVSQRGGVADSRLAEFRWLLEELRISLFAQELRTPMPVSVKRLHKVWESMQR